MFRFPEEKIRKKPADRRTVRPPIRAATAPASTTTVATLRPLIAQRRTVLAQSVESTAAIVAPHAHRRDVGDEIEAGGSRPPMRTRPKTGGVRRANRRGGGRRRPCSAIPQRRAEPFQRHRGARTPATRPAGRSALNDKAVCRPAPRHSPSHRRCRRYQPSSLRRIAFHGPTKRALRSARRNGQGRGLCGTVTRMPPRLPMAARPARATSSREA